MKEWYESHLTTKGLQDFFSFTGGIGRQSYILRSLAVGFLGGIIRILVTIMFAAVFIYVNSRILFWMLILLSTLLFLFMSLSWFSLWARRLHDLNEEGKYLIRVNMGLTLLDTVLNLITLYYFSGGEEKDLLEILGSVDSRGFEFIYLVLLPWMLYSAFWGILCIFKKGTEGPNQFGDDPLAPPRIES